jgi:hypothetical protein
MNLLREKRIFKEVIQTPEFLRLKDISFLGILAYCLKDRNKFTTRYDHCLAVANMCAKYSHRKNLSESETTYVVLAGLLHDIGHCAFSHSLEPVFEEKFKITHHTVSKHLITASPNLIRIWRKYDIDSSRIVDTIEGLSNFKNKIIAKMPINFDTLDGIARVEHHYGKSSRISRQVFDILCNHDDWENRTAHFDLFWKQKNKIYSLYIYGEKQNKIELLFQKFIKSESSLVKEDFLLSDPQLFSKFAWLNFFIQDIKNESHDFMRSKLNECILHSSMKRSTRRFVINLSGDFCMNNNGRYLVNSGKKEYRFKDKHGFAIFR